MRSRALQKAMARFALLAVLLLALVPTFGRLAQAAGHDPLDARGTVAMCTARGLERVPDPGHPEPAPHHDNGDCAYCPLLGSAVPPAPQVALAAAPAPAPALCTPSSSARVGAQHPCGLGSRGPPRVS
jgi:hypothetical protein